MRRVIVAGAAALAVLVSACSGTKLFYRQAEAIGTPTAYAKAVVEHHNAIGTQIVALTNNPSVSAQSKQALKNGYRVTVCSKSEMSSGVLTKDCAGGPSYQLDKAIRSYESVANAQTEADVQAAILQLTPLISQLINIIAGVK